MMVAAGSGCRNVPYAIIEKRSGACDAKTTEAKKLFEELRYRVTCATRYSKGYIRHAYKCKLMSLIEAINLKKG